MRYIVFSAPRIFFSPLPLHPLARAAVCNYRCRISAGPLYFLRGTYIPLLRRHSTPLLRIKCNAIPRLGSRSLATRDTDFDPLSVQRCFNFSKLFFFFLSFFSSFLFCFFFFSFSLHTPKWKLSIFSSNVWDSLRTARKRNVTKGYLERDKLVRFAIFCKFNAGNKRSQLRGIARALSWLNVNTIRGRRYRVI